MGKTNSSEISVCIATVDRAFLLEKTLNMLARQTKLPKEIIISDASRNRKTRELVELAKKNFPKTKVKYIESGNKALPWQRWNAFSHSTGEIVLFLDDDILPEKTALENLEAAYAEFGDQAAGVGFQIVPENGFQGESKHDLKIRAIKLAVLKLLTKQDSYVAGTITLGGHAISHELGYSNSLQKVEWLTGGAFSLRRKIAEKIGKLENLIRLYEKNAGAMEDSVFNSRATKYGDLYSIPIVAIHLEQNENVVTASPKNGFFRGFGWTYGRAHTMRWLSKNPEAYKKEWAGVAGLELLRSLLGIAKNPVNKKNWGCLLGVIIGITKAVLEWKKIPASPE